MTRRDFQRRWAHLGVRTDQVVRILAIVTLVSVTAPALVHSGERLGPQKPVNHAVPQVVACVNGQDVTRKELADECLRQYGEDVLETMTENLLIKQECKRRNIEVTEAEVSAEIERMATRFKLPVDQFLELIKEEQGSNPARHWNEVALRKIVQGDLVVSEEELKNEYEKLYGPSVKARMIACKSLEKANKLHAFVLANPSDFGNVAKNHSEDVNSASVDGKINPICRHQGYQEIEDAAFAMKKGDISPVIFAAGQYAILKCEGHIPAREGSFAEARPLLEESIRRSKLRVATRRFRSELREQANIVKVFNDPVEKTKHPGVAALINGVPVNVDELAEMCLERHGKEVLERTIGRRLIEQECERKQITVIEEEIDAEIANAAATMLPLRADGTPDVQNWLTLVCGQKGVSVDVYRHGEVWTSVALRKLVGTSVKITEEDIQRGFEANFGERVRCLAIVLDDHRRATKVWALARANPTREYFGELAEEYSVEAASRELRGEVRPIQRHGGQPLLEDVAFKLAPGELSSITQVGPNFIILLCEGRTTPEPVKLAEVRDDIYEDIHEKKLAHAMDTYYQQLRDRATINNLITGTFQSPTYGPARPQPAIRLVDLNNVVH